MYQASSQLSFISSSAMSTTIVDLWRSREAVNPSRFFNDMAVACSELSINQQDVYGDFAETSSTSWLRSFEAEVASHLGMEDAIFMPSGVMAQTIVLAASKKYGNSFVCHYSSHILFHEKNSYDELLGMTPLIVPARDTLIQSPLSYDEVSAFLDATPKPSVLIVELPHREVGGKITSWEDLVKMSEHCRRNNIRFQCDGARLWEAEAAYGKPMSELCALFDSIYVSFYKGLGGITGAMLLGKSSFIAETRDWLRRFGGNVFSLMPLAVSCWSGFRANKGTFYAKRDRLRVVVAALTDTFITNDPQSLLRFDPPVPQVSLIHIYINAEPSVVSEANEKSAALSGLRCFRGRAAAYGAVGQTVMEMNMGPLNLEYSLDVWSKGWTSFMNELQALVN